MARSGSFASFFFGLFSLMTSAEIVSSHSAKAQSLAPCTSSVSTGFLEAGICTTPAETYGITFYQIGICKNNPMTAAVPDTSSCFLLYNNSAGQYVDIGTSSPTRNKFSLANLQADQRPANGVYPYIFVSFSNTVNIKGFARVQDGTYYTSNQSYVNPDPAQTSAGSLGTTNISGYAAYPSQTRFFGNRCYVPEENMSLLTASNQAAVYDSGARTCTGAAKIAVSAESSRLFGSTFSISGGVSAVELQFTTPEAIGLIANRKVPGDPNGGYDYVFDFRGFNMRLAISSSANS